MTITREGTFESSISQLLQVTAEQGEPALTFSCSSDGVPRPTLMWRGQDGGTALPSGVAAWNTPATGVSLNLVWSRDLLYTDSGQYLCTAKNSNGSSTARLDLFVRREYICTVEPLSDT